jgi:hypothetical protein
MRRFGVGARMNMRAYLAVHSAESFSALWVKQVVEFCNQPSPFLQIPRSSIKQITLPKELLHLILACVSVEMGRRCSENST